nr:hypothetical protein [uncultured Holophaga sp.]
MLFHTFYYLTAALLIFQGVQLRGEQEAPLGTTPPELCLGPGPSRAWGRFLVLAGVVGLVCGFLNHGAHPRIGHEALGMIEGVLWLVMGAYGFWLIFLAKRVDFAPHPALADDSAHH